MHVFYTVESLRNHLSQLQGSVGFVPTMGALHHGHISLVAEAKKNCDVCVVSIFVNPTQFNNSEDLEKYPRTLEADCKLLEDNNCDIVFAPSVSEMYPSTADLQFNFGTLETVLEGAHRPGHFNGVGLVISKLFHIVNPFKAFFGQKDLQQVAIINKLVKDLSFQVEIVSCPTVREDNGLARSSRNERLSPSARKEASFIKKTLDYAQQETVLGKNIDDLLKEVKGRFEKNKAFKLEYFEIVDFEKLTQVKKYDPTRKTAITVAAFIDEVRLIDNVVF